MKKIIAAMIILLLMTGCGLLQTVQPEDSTTGTEDTSSIETDTGTTADNETTTADTTADDKTTDETTSPEAREEYKGGAVICRGEKTVLVQYDDRISIYDGDTEFVSDLPVQEYVWAKERWYGFQVFSKSRVMYNVSMDVDGKATSTPANLLASGEYYDYSYYIYDRYECESVIVDKHDKVLLSSPSGFSIKNGWLLDGDNYYHWTNAYSENLTKVTPEDSRNLIGPLEDGRIIIGERTSFKVRKQPDGAIESEHDGYDKVWYVAKDKVFVQKDGHMYLVDIDGNTVTDYGEFVTDDEAFVIGYQSGYGNDMIMTYDPADTDETGSAKTSTVQFDEDFYCVTIEGVRKPDPAPGYSTNCVEFYYIPSTGESGRIDNVLIGAIEKPVLYLYPTAPTEVTVTFAHPELLTTVYPEYRDGWRMFVQNNGTMTEIGKTREYYALYWEERPTEPYEFTEGFYVDKNYPEFLEEKLSELGLTDREANEFIMYWLPVLEKNGRNLVAFETTESREYANKLQIDPAPDSLLRISIHIKKVDSDPGLPEQKLPCFLRKGFTAVEWGGQVHT